jgi:hypothetical protein
MSCERFRKAITDHACGASIDGDAAAHLARCAACARMLDDRRHVLAEADEELRTVLAIIASPDFNARVSQRVQNARRSTNAAGWWWLTATAAAVLLTIGVLFMWSSRPDERSTRSTSATERSHPPAPVNVSAATKPNIERAPARIARTKAMSKPSAVVHRPAKPEVIVPPDQQRAIARLVELLRSGVLDAKALPEPPKTTELTIAPLSVPDIVVPDVQNIGGGSGPGAERE